MSHEDEKYDLLFKGINMIHISFFNLISDFEK